LKGLFDDQAPAAARDDMGPGTPLAERMRPRTLDDVLGHEKVVGADGFLRRAIDAGRIPSLVFWGPPGSGKTTLARILADATDLQYVPFSAVTSGIKEVRLVMQDAQRLRRSTGRRTLLFVDEIHRFNRSQQDAFLPYVEAGDIVLVGATTENPSFELNAALLSRARVVVLEPLSVDELVALLRRALTDPERGLGGYAVEATAEGLEEIAQRASGDARRALNLLELTVSDLQAVWVEEVDEYDLEVPVLTAEEVARVEQRKTLVYDKSGEEHFNLISAFHKSLRESDADAALYWMARMLAAGEDPLYLARRMVRFASEDVGLAEPRALGQAMDAWDAYHRLGSPEGELALAQAAVFLALSPKSDGVYAGYKLARRTVEERPADPVPKRLRNAPTKLMKETGYGEGYVYAHSQVEGVGGIDCLPDSLVGETFYRPTNRGFEATLGERLERFRELKRQVRERRDGGDGGS
jgi:putative ATPase